MKTKKQKLIEVRDAILNDPAHFDYRYIFSKQIELDEVLHIQNPNLERETSQLKDPEHNCGTCGCVAGYTLAVHLEEVKKHLDNKYFPNIHSRTDLYVAAYSVLGLTFFEAEFLFSPRSNIFTRLKGYDDYLNEYPGDKSFHFTDSYSFQKQFDEAINRLNFLIDRCTDALHDRTE